MTDFQWRVWPQLRGFHFFDLGSCRLLWSVSQHRMVSSLQIWIHQFHLIIGVFCRFLVENVASMTWIDRDEISKYLRVLPFELDSIELTPSKRRRLYWTNIPLPPRLPRVRDHPSTFVQSCLHNAIALEEKTGVPLFGLYVAYCWVW